MDEHVHKWRDSEFYCEDCGSHTSMRCEECGESVDLVMEDDPRDTTEQTEGREDVTLQEDAERAYDVVHAEVLNLFGTFADKLERDGFMGQPVPDLVRKLRETVAERRDGTTRPPV